MRWATKLFIVAVHAVNCLSTNHFNHGWSEFKTMEIKDSLSQVPNNRSQDLTTLIDDWIDVFSHKFLVLRFFRPLVKSSETKTKNVGALCG